MKSRNTLQKCALKDAIEGMSDFFTAEELLSKVQKKLPGTGIATIYRFLDEMKRSGDLHSYACNRKTIYSNHHSNHSHYICERCGKMTHIDITNIDFIRKNIPGTICHFQIEVHGTCDACRGKKP